MELLVATLGLRRLLLMVAVFVGLLLACVLIGVFAAPDVLVIETTELGRNEVWEASTAPVSSLNQAVFVYFMLETRQMDVTASKKLAARVLLKGRDSEDEQWATLWDRETVLALQCPEGAHECEAVRLARVPYVEYARYQVTVVAGPDSLPEWATGARIEFEMIHDRFTLFELWSRMALLALSAGMLGLFLWRLRKFRLSEWAVEQKWTLVLLASLVGLNDPFFALSLRWGFFDVLDQLLAAWFLAVLLLFWLVMFDTVRRPRPEDRPLRTFLLPKLALVGALWLALTALYLLVELLDDATHPAAIVCFVLTMLLTSGYIFWLLFIFVKLYPQLQVHPGVLFFFCFTCGVIVLTVGGILFGFLGPLRASATEFLAFFGLFNFYCFVLAVSYLPARGGGPQQRGLEIIQIGSSDEDPMASDLSMSSTDFEISLSDVGIQQPAQQIAEDFD